jgi:hypothetical protein
VGEGKAALEVSTGSQGGVVEGSGVGVVLRLGEGVEAGSEAVAGEDTPTEVGVGIVVRDENGQVAGEVVLRAVQGDASRYEGRWLADRAGRYVLSAADPALAGLGAVTEVEVISTEDELRRTDADHEKLASLAEATGGRVLGLDELGWLAEPGNVRSVARRLADDVVDPVWHSWAAWSLVVLLLTLEWSLRRWMRLA